MAARFMVITNGRNSDSDSRNTITNFVRSKGWGFWHHLSDLWLITGAPSTMTTKELWSEIDKLLPPGKDRLLVFDADNTRKYFGRLPPKSWPWLSKNWKS